MNKINSLIVLVIFLSVILGCSSADATKKAGAAVDRFHEQFNSKQFADIYENADEEFKKSATPEKLNELLEAVHRKLGTVKNAKQAGWHFNTTLSGTIVTLTYEVEFSQGKGTEQFIYKVNGDDVRLFNYNINSADLITN